MERWLKLSLLLCIFGFLKEIRPSEPYVTHFLMGPWKNFTANEVYEEIYPVGTYSTLALLVVVFLVTDFLRHKPVIVADALTGVAIYSLLIWAQGIPLMQVMEVLYGGFMAGEVAYYTYIYASVDRSRYQAVSGHTRAAYLVGRCTSGVMAQVLVSTGAMDYLELNYITLASMVAATMWALLLPSTQSSIYFHRDKAILPSHEKDSLEANDAAPPERMARAFWYLRRDLVTAYTSSSVVKWSLWWALATCGFYQVLNYTQLIWEEVVQSSGQQLYNGAVEAVYTVVGACSALALSSLRLNWQLLGPPALAACALVQAAAVYTISVSQDLWLSYAAYILCLAAYQALVTIASSEIAKLLKEECFGLIFGVNMFFALALQSILTLVVITWLQIAPREQFLIYGSYFAVLGVGFVFVALYSLLKGQWRGVTLKSLWLPKEERADT
ncbi:thiamine transporter 1 [Neocloeon triangulifer]|uniref:thiamine transporter 1 n=1 Tax=Neocloeon triangulifer TaxID=2078957 RepID=UPI00286EF4F8|nr:thiamine transporter 1 [Neocloeon triangulifer]XP_059487304.1 thiamine transporter 1 [Neocloeon triangulifer]XP_059487306.1 thiamine transporter 1 [Neocloeon triangulifer]XP_059487307.1 thiamine transporter 1 [Neocloeon triangulifer]